MSLKESKINIIANPKSKSNPKSNPKSNIDAFQASELTISTCTVINNLNSKINLYYLTRFMDVFKQYDEELEKQTGGIFNIEYYGNLNRGEILEDIKQKFNNQATIKFKYWGFRVVNVKLFANGKLQMTGTKYEDEANTIGKLLINIIQNIKVRFIHDIKNINIFPTKIENDFKIYYDKQTEKVYYYRKNYDTFLKNYTFDLDKLYAVKLQEYAKIEGKKYNFTLKRKGFIKGIHDTYIDPLEKTDVFSKVLNEYNWYGDSAILQIIDKMEMLKGLLQRDLEKILSSTNNIFELRDSIIELNKKYMDFKFSMLDDILNKITQLIYSTDSQTFLDIKTEIFKFNNQYRNMLESKINRLIIIRNIDVEICTYTERYLKSLKTDVSGKLEEILANGYMMLNDVELGSGIITEPHNYFVNNTKTVMINSNFTVNFNINLKKMSKILKKKGLFNTYDPDDHSGINTKYYYNSKNVEQGFCSCIPHCSTKEKNTSCTKITILVFRPGSIIITGSRSIEQLKATYKLILEIMRESMDQVKVVEKMDEFKQIALLNNEFRKVSRKPRLFFIKKKQIQTLDTISIPDN